jgi:hypothetical protein
VAWERHLDVCPVACGTPSLCGSDHEVLAVLGQNILIEIAFLSAIRVLQYKQINMLHIPDQNKDKLARLFKKAPFN